MSGMKPVIITLKRSPSSVRLGDLPERDEPAGGAKSREGRDAPPAQSSTTGAANEHGTRSSDPARSRSTSVATVITNPIHRVMTPLAQSSAVTVLSATTREVLTSERRPSEENQSEGIQELKVLLADVADTVAELKEQHRQSLNELQEVAVELATAAASCLVGFAVERDLFAIDELIQKALQHMDVDQAVRVRLNPDDHKLLLRLLEDGSSSDLLHQVVYEDAPEFARGTCRVESGRRVLLSDLNSRLEDIRRLWRETLDDSQVERREDVSASSSLRRFPDRRETA